MYMYMYMSFKFMHLTHVTVIRGCSGRKWAGPISTEQPWEVSLRGSPKRGRMARLPLLVMQARRRPSANQAMSAIQNVLRHETEKVKCKMFFARMMV